MKLIVGLGNPGKKYSHTRHNVGFMVLEEFAKLSNIRFKENKQFNALIGEGIIEGETTYLAMPQTFMNLSGHSVSLIVNWLKIDLREILLVIDDIALPFGEIRLKAKGSDAGHKGLSSVIDYLGSKGFSRLRIGVMGTKEVKDYSKYVLTNFTKKERKLLPEIKERAGAACECWIKEGIDVAMNRYNRRRIK